MLQMKLELVLMFITYILRDYFDFKDNLNKNCDEKKILTMWHYNIKYTNSKHEVLRSAIQNWFEKLQDDIPVLFHFKLFIYLFHLLFALMIFYLLFLYQQKSYNHGYYIFCCCNLIIAFFRIQMLQVFFSKLHFLDRG